VIRVYDQAGNVIDTHEHASGFKEPQFHFLFSMSSRTRTTLLLLTVLCIGAVAWFLGGPETSDRWNSVMSVATLLAVIAALFLDDVRALLHRPEIEFHVGRDLLDDWLDLDSGRDHAKWIRGRIKNIGDRGVERCRLKLLNVEGPNLPEQVSKVRNGFLQWESGIRDSMRLNPDEYWIFDIGTRRYDRNSDLRLWAHFAGDPI